MAGNGASTMLELALSFERADPNIPDNEGNTPLHFAAQAGKLLWVFYILSKINLKMVELFLLMSFYEKKRKEISRKISLFSMTIKDSWYVKISICCAEIFQGQRCSPCSNLSYLRVLRVIERIRPRGGYKFYKHFSLESLYRVTRRWW